jgi:hypothetical protein
VYGHEKPATVAYRANFKSCYFEYERRMHRWIQLSYSQALKPARKWEDVKNTGFSYKDSSDNQMAEFHVDNLKLFQQEMNEKNRLGGRLSVWFPNHLKPLIIIGHDECTFQQYSLSKKFWVAPDGQWVLVPKDKRQCVMVSAFQSRLPLSERV